MSEELDKREEAYKRGHCDGRRSASDLICDDHRKLEAERDALKLTGNENAVNCDEHEQPIAFIPANGGCPACALKDEVERLRGKREHCVSLICDALAIYPPLAAWEGFKDKVNIALAEAIKDGWDAKHAALRGTTAPIT